MSALDIEAIKAFLCGATLVTVFALIASMVDDMHKDLKELDDE